MRNINSLDICGDRIIRYTLARGSSFFIYNGSSFVYLGKSFDFQMDNRAAKAVLQDRLRELLTSSH